MSGIIDKIIAGDKSLDIQKQLEAIDGIDDENILFQIVINSHNFWIKRKALGKITSQQLIIKIAKTQKLNQMIKEEALGKVEDQELIAEIAKDDKRKDQKA